MGKGTSCLLQTANEAASPGTSTSTDAYCSSHLCHALTALQTMWGLSASSTPCQDQALGSQHRAEQLSHDCGRGCSCSERWTEPICPSLLPAWTTSCPCLSRATATRAPSTSNYRYVLAMPVDTRTGALLTGKASHCRCGAPQAAAQDSTAPLASLQPGAHRDQSCSMSCLHFCWFRGVSCLHVHSCAPWTERGSSSSTASIMHA